MRHRRPREIAPLVDCVARGRRTIPTPGGLLIFATLQDADHMRKRLASAALGPRQVGTYEAVFEMPADPNMMSAAAAGLTAVNLELIRDAARAGRPFPPVQFSGVNY